MLLRFIRQFFLEIMIAFAADFLSETNDRRFPALCLFRQLEKRIAADFHVIIKTILGDALLALGEIVIMIFDFAVNRHRKCLPFILK